MDIKEWHTVKAAIALKTIVFRSDGKLLILQRPKDDYSRPLGWDLIGGGLNNFEDPIDGARREIKEEANLEVAEIKPIAITSFKEDDGCFSIMVGFKALATTGEVKLSSEHIAFKWVTPKELLNSDLPEIYKEFVKADSTICNL